MPPWLVALGVVLGLGLFAMFVWTFKSAPITGATGAFTAEAVEAAGGNTRVVSELMFSEYILPFELTSVLLLAAIVGAVAMAKRGKGTVRVKKTERGTGSLAAARGA